MKNGAVSLFGLLWFRLLQGFLKPRQGDGRDALTSGLHRSAENLGQKRFQKFSIRRKIRPAPMSLFGFPKDVCYFPLVWGDMTGFSAQADV